MVSPGEDLRLVSVPSNGPGKGLLLTDIQGKQLRGDLPEELPFSLNRGQRMNQLPLLVFVSDDLKPFGRDFSTNLVPVSEQKSRHPRAPQRNQAMKIGCYRCIPRFPDQRAFSTESMDAGLEEQSPVELRFAVLSQLLAGLAVRVPQKETVLQ